MPTLTDEGRAKVNLTLRVVGRRTDGRSRDAHPKDPVDDPIDMVGPGSRSQANGEADVVIRRDSTRPAVTGRGPPE